MSKFDGHKVGTTYEVVADLLLLDPATPNARLTIPSFDVKEKELALGSSARERELKIPIGTRLKLVSVDRTGHRSWNTGTYYIHKLTVQILSGPHANQMAEGKILFIDPTERSWDDRSEYIRKEE